jgi:hypothetical protein
MLLTECSPQEAQPCDAADARLERFDPLKIIAGAHLISDDAAIARPNGQCEMQQPWRAMCHIIGLQIRSTGLGLLLLSAWFLLAGFMGILVHH